jgi:ribonuclease T1
MSHLKSLKLALTGFILIGVLVCAGVQAKASSLVSESTPIALAELPRQGAQTYQLIHLGGLFAHEKDGVVFGNRERLLPLKKRGYYLEYTVASPTASNRGVRRIVCGGPARTPEACYYSADHYASFRKIVP